MAGLGANDNSEARRLEAEAGYGFPVYGDRYTGTPYLGLGLSEGGRDWRIGWRLGFARHEETDFTLSLEATRLEAVNDNAPEHGIGFRLTARW